MMDYVARERLRNNQSNKSMMEATKNAIKDGFASKGPEDTLKMVFEKNEDPEVKSLLEKIARSLPLIEKIIPRSFALPKVFQIKGSVNVENPITVNNLSGMEGKLGDMATQLRMLAQAISSIPAQKIEFPKLDIPKAEKVDFGPMVEAVDELKAALEKKSDGDSIPVLRDIKKAIQSLVDRPVLTPQPVTNININALQGFGKSTAQTVGTTRATIPSYGQLFNRRSLIVFNNDATNNLYLGGSDVTTSNGLPVLPQTFSPSIDAGYNMTIYAVAGTSVNIRVFEVSKDQTANIQE